MAEALKDDCQTVDITEEPIDEEWSIGVVKGKDPTTRKKPLIQQVAGSMLEILSGSKDCFLPSVVSFGPCHHGEEKLMPMESCKEAAARWFVSLARSKLKLPEASILSDVTAAKAVYRDFLAGLARTPRSSPISLVGFYAEPFSSKFAFNDFMRMMFLDGCFILQVVYFVLGREGSKGSNHFNVPLVVRDMFLLDNQIPFPVLKALMSLVAAAKPGEKSNLDGEICDDFISTIFLDQKKAADGSKSIFSKMKCMGEWFPTVYRSIGVGSPGTRAKDDDGDPFHLLDLLRSKLIGKTKDSQDGQDIRYWNYYFRSVMELKAKGVRVKKSRSKQFRDIDFRESVVHGYLFLPPLVVDDGTKTSLLNLIAYEMCPDAELERVVTSFVCFLDHLIDSAEDVTELRSKGVLLNRLGNDDEVAKLFNELAANLAPSINICAHIMGKIDSHIKKKGKVWLAEFQHSHFSSPWTILALIAAILVLLMTLAQTIYSVWSFYK